MRALQRQAQAWRTAPTSPTEPPPPPALVDYWRARYPHYQLARHIVLMLDALADLGDGEGLIVTIAPRHSKSESIKAWLEWSLGQFPDAEAILASYSIDLARRHSRSIRNEIASGRAFPAAFPHVRLAEDSQAATDWGLSQGGRFRAAGVGVGITGMGARLGVIDDPFKDRRSAESQVVRDTVWEWFTSAFLTRLTPDARLVLTHTRWHPDDLAGRILARLEAGEGEELGGLRWKHLNLLAIYDDPSIQDPLNRELGEALWPERYNLARLRAIQQVSEYDFEALYQQRPRKRGGSVFSDKPVRWEQEERGGRRLVIAVDTASSKRTTADYTAFVVLAGWGAGAEAQADVLEVQRGRLNLQQLAETAQDLQRRYGGTAVVIEETAQSLPIIEFLRMNGIHVKPVRPVGDKFTRSQPAAAAWNAGRIRVPGRSVPWLPDFLGELAAFTGTDADPHDDQVDALSYAWAELHVAPDHTATGALAAARAAAQSAERAATGTTSGNLAARKAALTRRR